MRLLTNLQNLPAFLSRIPTIYEDENFEVELSLMFYTGDKTVLKEEKQIEELAVEHFIELIRENLHSSSNSAENKDKQQHAEGEEEKGASGGLLEQDKVGVKRLVEALQCNMWSNM